EVPSCADAGQLFDSLSPDFGLEYVGLVTVGASDPSYTAPCLELVNSGTEVINLGVEGATALSVIEECQLQGYEGMYSGATTTVSAADFEGVEGLRLIGSLNGFPWWADAPPAQQFRDAVDE